VLGATLVSLVGVIMSMQIEKKNIRREVKRMLMRETLSDQLVRLVFESSQTTAEIRWVHDGEFSYAGTMYDVVSQKEEGDSVVFICWPDHAESAVNQRLSDLADLLLQGRKPSENEKQLNSFIQKLYCDRAGIQLTLPSFRCEKVLALLQLALPSPAGEPDSPPPRVC